MRTPNQFVNEYRAALKVVNPSQGELDTSQQRKLACTELCLALMVRHLPHESVRCIPSVMMGYPKLLGQDPDPRRALAVSNARHLCPRFGSMSAWLDALAQYHSAPETLRCFSIAGNSVSKRPLAPPILLAVVFQWLEGRVPWAERKSQVAEPGNGRIWLDSTQSNVDINVPTVSVEQQLVRRFEFTPRTTNPPIEISFNELRRIAFEVDTREKATDWPSESLPRLNLQKRLETLVPEKDMGGFFDGEKFSLNGATHVVGMLSSGKSTFAMALLFALTRGSGRKRVAVLVSDTMQGAVLSARLRRHGVCATVLASFRRRMEHLQSIHWQQSLQDAGQNLSSLGHLTEGFSTACPLDGVQPDQESADGGVGDKDRDFPRFSEKPCHHILQSRPKDEKERPAGNPDDVDGRENTRSCPLWATCPAQSQQRTAVDAAVLIMTPTAFVHITPDPWTSTQRLCLPELVQYEFDLVIVDEVDSVQKSLDEIFAQPALIMGAGRDTYAPGIGRNSSEAIRIRSGSQFRKPINAKWQSNFFTFFRLIGVLYAMLQNEREALAPFFRDTTFTAGSILYELWRRAGLDAHGHPVAIDFNKPEVVEEFLDVIKVAASIRKIDPAASVSEEDMGEPGDSSFNNPRFGEAAEALQQIARRLLLTDSYDSVYDDVETQLGERLEVFAPPLRLPEGEDKVERRSATLALVLATVTDLAMSHYNWLAKTQAAVARDFQLDDGFLLGRAGGLIQNYRTLIPANPAGAAFGFLYDEPDPGVAGTMGGELSLISHLGVGRHLITHLHDLLQSEGQAGPHTLLLSGTSWAGGSLSIPDPKDESRLMACSSPMFDVQLPVTGVFVQPAEELEAIRRSEFALVRVVSPSDTEKRQVSNDNGNNSRKLDPQRISGAKEKVRRDRLKGIAAGFASPRNGLSRFERDWRRVEANWSDWRDDALKDRRRALLVTNSYADAATVADALADAHRRHQPGRWSVFCLVPDGDETGEVESDKGPKRAHALPRSLVERFGERDEYAVLVAPMLVIGRGHNILNRQQVAAISSIYFLHRAHPRPNDLGPLIGRLNRFAQERFDNGIKASGNSDSFTSRATRMRKAADRIVGYGLSAGRRGYSGLPPEYKAQFAWDMLTLLWQTVGRGIRRGRPVFVGFVDTSFAPLSFPRTGDRRNDTAASSTLVQCIEQMRLALSEESNPGEFAIARLLYEPFYEALRKTEGLLYVQK